MPTSRAREKLQQRADAQALVPQESPDADEALAASFASFATTVQNRLDNNGSGSPIALNGSLEAQVERALSQALRQPATNGGTTTTYGGIGSPATALAPTISYGSVIGHGSSPALPTAQTVLVGEAMATQSNMLSALDALQPLSPLVDESDVAAYRDIVRAEVLALTTEFARPDQPRPVRVRVLFGALLGWAYAPGYRPVAPQPDPDDPFSPFSGDLAALTFLLKKCTPIVPSALTEEQVALQDVLTADAKRLFDLWVAFEYPPPFPQLPIPPVMWPDPEDFPRNISTIGGLAAVRFSDNNCYGDRSPGEDPPEAPPFSFSERMIRADLLLPVLSHDSDQVAGALDAVGFGPGAQETVPIPELFSATDNDLSCTDLVTPIKENVVLLPILRAHQTNPSFGLTVKDLLDWASDLAGGAGYELLREAGQLGLDLLADQADELFWIVETLLLEPPEEVPELGDSQVQLELRSLARDLSALGDLSN